jgi:PAS domain S-box-containing protein
MPVPAPDYELGQSFDLSRDLFCIAGFDGYFKWLNPSFERVLGYSGEELMSRPFLEFVHPDDVERARDAFVHLAAGEDIIGFESRLVCVDGSVRRFEWNTRTLPHLGALYGIARDVTDRSALAEEQAALRRVAVLVAQQPSPSEVFTAVTQAVGLLLDADLAVLHVFPGDGTATTIASWSGDDPILPIGTRFPLDGDSLAARIFETGAPARMYSSDEAWEREATDLARSLRVRSAVGAPILVEGKLWGALMAATRGVEPWAENAETRIAAFTELVATAIANAESREALAELADEQAALRRVATLVAQGVSPQDLFEAVAEEVGRLLPVGSATMGRYESDGSITTVASWSTTEAAFPTGRRWPTEGTNVAWMVLQTGQAARLDDFAAATDPIGVAARESGIKSAVGSPIVVEGHLWGVMTATSTEGPMPRGTEARLASFTELVATAIANAESSAEIAASRRRIVAASDDARRRIVRDLHDGAQQRLVHTVITLKLAQQALAKGADNGPWLVQEAVGHAERATHELRELAHGILPATLTAGGLRAGVGALASRMPVPVEVAIPADRLPAPIEATAYFVVAEALTNVAKHARAASAAVAARIEDGTLRVEVRDDGVGGARPQGTGLQGLRDRLAALDGRLQVESPASGGTLVAAAIPIPASAIER